MDLGKDIEEGVIEEKMKLQRANQCAAVVFSVYQPLITCTIQSSSTIEDLQ